MLPVDLERPATTLSVEEALTRAVAFQQAGRLQEAEALYRGVLYVRPRQPDALHNLGAVALQLGKPGSALPYLKAALDTDPRQGQYWISYVEALLAVGQVEAARQVLGVSRARGLQGDSVDALAQRVAKAAEAVVPSQAPEPSEVEGLLALFGEGKWTKVEAVAQAMIRRYPMFAFGWSAWGAALRSMGRPADALEPLSRAAALAPAEVESHSNLGGVFSDLGRHAEAEGCFRRATELRPDSADAHFNLASALHDLGRHAEAEAQYRIALAQRRGHAPTLHGLAMALEAQGRKEEAQSAYEEAVSVDASYVPAHFGLGVLFQTAGKIEQARRAYRSVLTLAPGHLDAYVNLGSMLAMQGLDKNDEAMALFQEALGKAPEVSYSRVARPTTLAHLHYSLGMALSRTGRLAEAVEHYRQAVSYRPGLAEAGSNLLFDLAYGGLVGADGYLREARQWELRVVSAAVRQVARDRHPVVVPRAGRRLKVGYVSGDFGEHPVGFFMEPLLRMHDRQRVHITLYSTSHRDDAVTTRMRQSADHWVLLRGLSDDEARQRIAADGIDVLVDLAGHSAFNRLGVFARRAAPVQAHYLGYFASTGLSEMDYWIGDANLLPPSEDSNFCEALWRLPRVWVSYQGAVEAPSPNWQPRSGQQIRLGSFNALNKLTAATISLWARVLNALPEAKLLLKTSGLSVAGNRERIVKAFHAHGVASDRLELVGDTLPWRQHMAFYDRVDVALDPVGGMGGATTTGDALWMAVPVVTLAGSHMAQRTTASMLHAIGRSEWIAANEAEYIEKVVALARDRDQMKILRETQRATMQSSALCDTLGLARHLEQAYEQMFDARTKLRY